MSRVTVTGGAGYVGALVVDELLAGRPRRPRARRAAARPGGAWRAPSASAASSSSAATSATPTPRAAALEGVDAVVHLAAIVGDPACARDPELSHAVNVEGTPRARRATPRAPASSGSSSPPPARTTAAWPTPRCRSTEDGELAPVSLYAEQKVGIEQALLNGDHGDLAATCLRFATVYGVGAAHALRPHGQRVHPRPLGRPRPRGLRRAVLAPVRPRARRRPRASATVLEAPAEDVAGEVFNVGRSDENYRKLDLVELITGAARTAARCPTCSATRTRATTRCPSTRSASVLGFETPIDRARRRSREIVGALDDERFGDPFDGRATATSPKPRIPLVRPAARADEDVEAVDGGARARAGSRWARGSRSSRRPSPTTSACRHARRAVAAAPRRCTSPTSRPASGPGDEVIVPADHVRGDRERGPLLRRDARLRRRHRPARPRDRPRRRRGAHHRRARRPSAPCTTAATRRRSTRLRRALRRARARADRGRRARAERRRPGRTASSAPSGTRGCFRFFSNKVLSCGEGGLLATDDDDVADASRARSARTR